MDKHKYSTIALIMFIAIAGILVIVEGFYINDYSFDCTNGQIPKVNGSGIWTCAADNNSGGSGDYMVKNGTNADDPVLFPGYINATRISTDRIYFPTGGYIYGDGEASLYLSKFGGTGIRHTSTSSIVMDTNEIKYTAAEHRFSGTTNLSLFSSHQNVIINNTHILIGNFTWGIYVDANGCTMIGNLTSRATQCP